MEIRPNTQVLQICFFIRYPVLLGMIVEKNKSVALAYSDIFLNHGGKWNSGADGEKYQNTQVRQIVFFREIRPRSSRSRKMSEYASAADLFFLSCPREIRKSVNLSHLGIL